MNLFFDGFEQFNLAPDIASSMRKAGYTVGGGSIATNVGRVGGKSISTYRTSIGRSLPWTGDKFSFGFACKFTARGGICSFTGGILIMDSVNGLPSFLGVTGGSIPVKARWYYYEVEFTRSTRQVEVFINNKSQGTAAMPDTLYGANEVTVALNAYNAPTSVENPSEGDKDSATRIYDDFYMREDARLTPIQVTTRFPTDDVRTDWQVIPEGIAHSQAVGKLPVDELDRYILTNKDMAVDSFSSTDKLPDDHPVLATGAIALLRKTDADGSTVDLAVGSKGSSISDLSTKWKYYYRAWDADANDTPASVNDSLLTLTAHITR